MPRDAHDILTSLPLEILLYFNQYFTILYVVVTVGQLVYKGTFFFLSFRYYRLEQTSSCSHVQTTNIRIRDQHQLLRYDFIYIRHKSRQYEQHINILKQALFVIFYIFVDRARLYIGSKGNKTEQIVPMLLFHLLCVPIIITNVYVMCSSV